VPEPGLIVSTRPYLRQVTGLLVIGSLAGIAMNTAVVLPAVFLGHAIDVVLAVDRGAATAGDVTRAAVLVIAGSLATELPRIGKRWWLGIARNRIRASLRPTRSAASSRSRPIGGRERRSGTCWRA
jgi:hypothetical protein